MRYILLVAALAFSACQTEDQTSFTSELTPAESAQFADNLGVSVEALGTPVAYTKINSNGGAPLCAVQNSQCVPIQALGQRAHRAARSWVQSMKPNGGPNAWTCDPLGTTCLRPDNSRAVVGLCSGATNRCKFMTCPGPNQCNISTDWEGEVALDATGQFALYYFRDGGFGQSNPAGHTFWYSAP